MINSMIPLHHNNHYCSVAGVVHQLLPHSSACYFLCQVFHHDCPHFFLVSPTFLWGKNRNKYHLQCAHDAITQVNCSLTVYNHRYGARTFFPRHLTNSWQIPIPLNFKYFFFKVGNIKGEVFMFFSKDKYQGGKN